MLKESGEGNQEPETLDQLYGRETIPQKNSRRASMTRSYERLTDKTAEIEGGINTKVAEKTKEDVAVLETMNKVFKTHYEVLGVDKDATDYQLEEAFEKKSHQWEAGEITNEEYEEATNATEVLFDEKKRAKYNESLSEKIKLKKKGEKTEPPKTLAETELNLLPTQETKEVSVAPKKESELNLDPNLGKETVEGSDKDLTPQKVEAKLKRIIEKATRIVIELNSNGVNSDVELLKEYLNGTDKGKLKDEKGLNQKRVDWLKEQCMAIITMAQDRELLIEGADEETLKNLNKKIKKAEVREFIVKEFVERQKTVIEKAKQPEVIDLAEMPTEDPDEQALLEAAQAEIKEGEESEAKDQAKLEQLRTEAYEQASKVLDKGTKFSKEPEEKQNLKNEKIERPYAVPEQEGEESSLSEFGKLAAKSPEKIKGGVKKSAGGLRGLIVGGLNGFWGGIKQIRKDFADALGRNFGEKEEVEQPKPLVVKPEYVPAPEEGTREEKASAIFKEFKEKRVLDKTDVVTEKTLEGLDELDADRQKNDKRVVPPPAPKVELKKEPEETEEQKAAKLKAQEIAKRIEDERDATEKRYRAERKRILGSDDPYEILGVPKNATFEKIRERCRALDGKYVEFRNPGDEEAKIIHAKVLKAYNEIKTAQAPETKAEKPTAKNKFSATKTVIQEPPVYRGEMFSEAKEEIKRQREQILEEILKEVRVRVPEKQVNTIENIILRKSKQGDIDDYAYKHHWDEEPDKYPAEFLEKINKASEDIEALTERIEEETKGKFRKKIKGNS